MYTILKNINIFHKNNHKFNKYIFSFIVIIFPFNIYTFTKLVLYLVKHTH